MLTYFLSSKTRGDQNIQRVWKLKGPHRLNLIHQKIGHDIKYFQLAGENNTFELSQLKKGANGLEMRNT